jgi:hypothetical protein
MKKQLLVLLAAAVLFSSCMGIGRKKVNNPGDIGKDEVLVVGKVVYDPPMTNETQEIIMLGGDALRYKTWLICGTKLRKIAEAAINPSSPDLEGAIETVQDETFYTVNRNYPIYFIAGLFYKKAITTSCGYNCWNTYYGGVFVPGSFYIDIKPEDKAVYVGTIKYTRDNFWNIKRIQIIDDYNKTMPEFRAKFPGMELRKALIREPAPGVVPEVGSAY